MIALDLPGHGDSGMPCGDDHSAMTAPIAIGLRQILPPDTPIDLVGFSFGGVIAAYFAAEYPDLSGKLVLVGTPGLGVPVGDILLKRIGSLKDDARHKALRANLLELMLHSPESVDDLAVHLLVTNAENARLKAEVRSGLALPDKLVPVC